MKLKNKFLIIFLLISTIPVYIITVFTYSRYTRLIRQQITQAAENICEKAELSANTTLDNIRHISELFNFYSESTHSIIDDIKKYTSKDNGYSYYDILQSNQNIRFLCENLIFTYDYINGIFIFTPSGVTLGYGYGNSIDIQPGYLPYEDEWYLNTLSKNGGLYIDGVSKKDYLITQYDSITFSKAMYDVYTKEFLGVLIIDCSEKVFDLTQVNTMPDISLLSVQEEDGNILYSNQNMLSENFVQDKSLSRDIPLEDCSLHLQFSADSTLLNKEFGFTRILLLALSGICLVVFFIISVLTSHSISEPIIHLSEEMAAREGYNLETSTRYLNRTDEIGILYNEYNHMLETIQEYIRKELQNKLITLDSQMKSLEAQINSHFLYNTLESINSIAEIEEVEDICTMSLALGNMFRYNIKTQSELVTIADELKHVHDYASIQQIRFDNRFRIEYEIPEEMKGLQLLKLILQPLVENALYHGLQYCRFGSMIRISGYTENQKIILSVSDDGIGMEREQLEKLRTELKQKAEFKELGHRNKQSIGIKNINTRIVLYYGESYGLTIDSIPKNGTVITLQLPLIQTGQTWRR